MMAEFHRIFYAALYMEIIRKLTVILIVLPSTYLHVRQPVRTFGRLRRDRLVFRLCVSVGLCIVMVEIAS